jgi:FAD binding domain-containing protein/berberine-like enzyme
VHEEEGLTRRQALVAAGAAAGAVALGGRTAASLAASDPVRALRRVVKGPVFRVPNSSSLVYDLRYAGVRPLAVAQPESSADVAAAVKFCVGRGIPVAARSGGHSYAGYSTQSGGVVLDLRRLNGVRLSGGTATLGPGAQLIDVYRKLNARGVTVPAGSCPSVCIGGHATGGGMGLAGRKLGLLLDRVVGLTVVTADGRVRQVDGSGAGSDLFWALRGGGGRNFGIVTAFEMRPAAVPRTGSWFSVSVPFSQASAALAAWQAWAPHTSTNVTSIVSLAPGRIGIFGQSFGSESQLRGLLGPLRRVSGARVTTGTSSYFGLMQRWAGCAQLSVAACHTRGTSPGGTLPKANYAAKSRYFSKPLSSAGRAAMLRAVGRAPGGSSLLLDSWGGAINTVSPSATAFVHRDALFAVQELTYFGSGSGGAHTSWLAATDAALAPFSNGEAYQNYIDPTLKGWRQAYYGANYSRLASIQAKYDPDLAFRFKQSIGSAA